MVSVSMGDTAGVDVSTGSGLAVSNGLTEGRGEGLVVGLGLGFGLAVGVGVGEGDSSVVAGLLAWNGVEAASCARTRAAEVNNTRPKTNERIMTGSNFCADASARASAGSRSNPIRSSSSGKETG